jgi:hypothetical protein
MCTRSEGHTRLKEAKVWVGVRVIAR